MDEALPDEVAAGLEALVLLPVPAEVVVTVAGAVVVPRGVAVLVPVPAPWSVLSVEEEFGVPFVPLETEVDEDDEEVGRLTCADAPITKKRANAEKTRIFFMMSFLVDS